jgi:hypothetical protein
LTSLSPTRIGTQPPEPFMPLRPSHVDIIWRIFSAE